MSQSNVVWTPQAKQRLFMSRPEYEAFYGGAAGGGKSECLVIEGLRQVEIPHYKGLILRRTFPQLRELIQKSQSYYPRIFPGSRFNDSKHTWKFPSGSTIEFGNLQREADLDKYQGRAFDYIAFDELTHFTFDQYIYLFSRNRPNGPGTRAYIRSSGNPGGVGHGWVKDRFVTAAPAMTPIKSTHEAVMPDGKIVRFKFRRIFVPSSVFDNAILLSNDPAYVGRLAALPPKERDALLYGNWDSFAGQVFTEFVDDDSHYIDGIGTHVIRPFDVPGHWKIIRSFDWGYSKPFSVGWWAVDTDGCYYRIQELYGCQPDRPNTGLQLDVGSIATRISALEHADPNLRNRRIRGVADPSIFASDRGESIASIMARQKVHFEPADNERIAGKLQLHHRMVLRDNGRPLLQVFNTCRAFIRTIPALVYDKNRVEDIDTEGEDHVYDEARYAVMLNQITHPIKAPAEIKPYNPMEDVKSSDKNRFAAYRRY